MSYYGNEPWMYTTLQTGRSAIVDMIDKELSMALAAGDHSRQIAEDIADDVANDICDTADVEKWNDSDLRLAIGRVLAKNVERAEEEKKRDEASRKMRGALLKAVDILCENMEGYDINKGESITFCCNGRKYIMSLNFLGYENQ